VDFPVVSLVIVLTFGIGPLALFVRNGYLLGRDYFEL
jgi:hypothetical protein